MSRRVSTSIKLVKFVEFPYESRRYWRKVEDLLGKPIPDIQSLISVLYALYGTNIDTQILELCLEQAYNAQERKEFYSTTLPRIQKLVLDTPNLFHPFSIPVLEVYKNNSVSLTREQCACILANSFFNTWDRDADREEELCSINFLELYSAEPSAYAKESYQKVVEPKIAKLLMILNYFRRIAQQMPTGHVTFSRQFVDKEEFPEFSRSTKKLLPFTVMKEGSIEDAHDAIQADFANSYIGGSVLSHGAVQEEIRFCMCPELICSRLFCEMMHSTEAILFSGAECFSLYEGYGPTLKFGGDYIDTNKDEQGNIKTKITAFDAMVFKKDPHTQWDPELIERELRKACAAFADPELGFPEENVESTTTSGASATTTSLEKVATGNWGCGVFKGDKQLKSMIQWIAATLCGREVLYYTFGEAKFSDRLKLVVDALIKNGITAGQLYRALERIQAEFERDPFEYEDVDTSLPSTFKLLNYLLDLNIQFPKEDTLPSKLGKMKLQQ